MGSKFAENTKDMNFKLTGDINAIKPIPISINNKINLKTDGKSSDLKSINNKSINNKDTNNLGNASSIYLNNISKPISKIDIIARSKEFNSMFDEYRKKKHLNSKEVSVFDMTLKELYKDILNSYYNYNHKRYYIYIAFTCFILSAICYILNI